MVCGSSNSVCQTRRVLLNKTREIQKMTSKKRNNYLDSDELDQEMARYVDTGEISERLG